MTHLTTYAIARPIAGDSDETDELLQSVLSMVYQNPDWHSVLVKFNIADLEATFGGMTIPNISILLADPAGNLYRGYYPVNNPPVVEGAIILALTCMGHYTKIFKSNESFLQRLVMHLEDRNRFNIGMRMEIQMPKDLLVNTPFEKFQTLANKALYNLVVPRHSINQDGVSTLISATKDKKQ